MPDSPRTLESTFAGHTKPTPDQNLHKSFQFPALEKRNFKNAAPRRRTLKMKIKTKRKIMHEHNALCMSNSGFSARLKCKTISQRSLLLDGLVG